MGKNLLAHKLSFELQERKRYHYGVMIIDMKNSNKSLASLILKNIKEKGLQTFDLIS